MYCKKCGKEISDDSKYCSYCGAYLGEKININDKPSSGQYSFGSINKINSEHNDTKMIKVNKSNLIYSLCIGYDVVSVFSLITLFMICPFVAVFLDTKESSRNMIKIAFIISIVLLILNFLFNVTFIIIGRIKYKEVIKRDFYIYKFISSFFALIGIILLSIVLSKIYDKNILALIISTLVILGINFILSFVSKVYNSSFSRLARFGIYIPNKNKIN